MSKNLFRDLASKFFTARWSDRGFQEFLSQPEVWNEKDPEELPVSEEEALSDEEAERLQNRLLLRINREIDQQEKGDQKPVVPGVPHLPKVRVLHSWRQGVRVAAAIAMLIAIGFALTWQLRSTRPSATETIVWSNSSPQAKHYTLSDGSTVWLNTGTKLSLPKEFPAEKREVQLSGEAFFEVAKDSQRPFIIHTGHVVIRVLGTSFNIKAFAGEDVEVVVVTGKVVVETKEPREDKQNPILDRVELRPQEKAIISKKSQKIEREVVQTGSLPGAWKEEQLLFEDVQMAEVIKTLSRKHKIQIETENELLKNCRLNVDLTGQSAENAIRIISELINAQYHAEKDKIIIKGEGCPGK